MASALGQLPPLLAPRVPMIEPRTGLVSELWYIYLKRLDEHIREIEKRLDAGGL